LDQHGTRVGSVADAGHRAARAAFQPDRFAARIERARIEGRSLMATIKMAREMPSGRLEVRDEAGAAVLVLTTAGPWSESPLITVARGDGVTIGTITLQKSMWRKPRYALEASGQRVGTIVNDRWWSLDHHVLDAQEREVARIASRRSGWFARKFAGEPVTFAVQISLPLRDPLHSLLLAGALLADIALKRHEPSDVR
jgi:hypothetical protein